MSSTFLGWVLSVLAAFSLGYWIAGHPDDARSFAARAKDAVMHLYSRVVKPKGGSQ